jgi:mRNA interferase MazF
MYKFGKPGKRRPVVVLTRDEVIPFLRTVMVAPVTSTIHGAPSEVVVGTAAGFTHDSAVNLDHVQTVEQRRLERLLGRLEPGDLRRVCEALEIAVGCDR